MAILSTDLSARSPRSRTALTLAALTVTSLLAACATPALRLDRAAASAGFELLEIQTTDFLLRAYRKPGAAHGGRVHVYLEGDGLPWATPAQVSWDPHPRRALAFELMRQDPAPAIYLKRPCYQSLRAGDSCRSALWTHERYGEVVVANLEAALRTALAPGTPVVLIGYSGGGVLAVLLAERLERVRAVVTIAANLDLDAWTGLHGYSPLTGSLDPAARPPLPARIAQWHLAGGRDVNVPKSIVERFVRRQAAAELVVYPELDHSCCWGEVWPAFLHDLAAR